MHEYGFGLCEITKGYDAIIMAVSHDDFSKYDEPFFKSIANDKAIFVDIKGTFRNKIKELNYWSL